MPKFLGFWRTRFAFFPVHMDDGSLVWLRRFEERQVVLADTEWLGGGRLLVRMRRRAPERMIP